MVEQLLQRTVDGLLDGSAYALVGLGLTLTFGTLRRLNLAYGAGAMLAAYVGAWLYQRHGTPPWAVAAAVVATATLTGLYVEHLCFARGRAAAGDGVDDAPQRAAVASAGHDGREVVALASTFAVWMQLEQLAVNLLPRHLNPFPSLAASVEWALGGIFLRTDRLALAALALVLTAALCAWLRHSRGGLAWRASADRPVAAALAGIPVARVQMIAFAVACALSGLAAFAVLAIDGQVTPMFGMWVLMKGLVAAMLGGLGSVPGVLAGGWLLGLAEAHAQGWFGALGRQFTTYALLFAVLVLRHPAGMRHGR